MRIANASRYNVNVRTVVLLLGVLALSAVGVAKSVSPAKPNLGCKAKVDCAFTHFDEECCWRCGARVGNATWVADVEAFCKTHPAKRCPVPSCGEVFMQLACVDGLCVRR